jgi:hypothetical protein
VPAELQNMMRANNCPAVEKVLLQSWKKDNKDMENIYKNLKKEFG